MNKESSKRIILIVMVVFVTIIVLAGFTYALFSYSRTSSNESSLQAGMLEFGYIEESNGINLENAMPISDTTALNTTNSNDYFDFYVTYDVSNNATIEYEIDIENITAELSLVADGTFTEMNSSRIKVALENRNEVGTENPMIVNPTYFSELERTPASNSKAGYVLHKTSITGNQTDYYRLYMWIPEVDFDGNVLTMSGADEYSINEQAFSVRINVQAVANHNN